MTNLHIVGTRPQFIKLAEFWREGDEVLTTGQHWEKNMSELLGLPPINYDLNLRTSDVALMAQKLTKWFTNRPYNVVTVYGDSNTTLAGAIAAKIHKAWLVHIEAGLRCGRDIPEESNRILTDYLSDYLRCPTQYALENVRNYPAEIKTTISNYMEKTIRDHYKVAQELPCPYKDYYLLTVHRQENIPYIRQLLDTLGYSNMKFIFPCHPHTRKFMESKGIIPPKNIEIIPPQDYLSFLSLVANADIVLTDSGGVTYEAWVIGKPCVILRNETEWKHTNFPLVGIDGHKIIDLLFY